MHRSPVRPANNSVPQDVLDAFSKPDPADIPADVMEAFGHPDPSDIDISQKKNTAEQDLYSGVRPSVFALIKPDLSSEPVAGTQPSEAPLQSPVDPGPQTPTADTTATTPPVQPLQKDEPPANAIDLSLKADSLASKQVLGNTFDPITGAQTATPEPDQDAIAESEKIKTQVKGMGYNADSLIKLFKGVPERAYGIVSKEKLLENLKTDPEGTERQVATFKWQLPALDAIRSREQTGQGDPQTLAADEKTLIESNSPNIEGYANKRIENRYAFSLLQKYAPDQETLDTWKKNFAIDKTVSYGSVPDNDPSLVNDPLAVRLNNNQLRGLHYLEDTDPKKAKGYYAAFVAPAQLVGDDDAQTGQQEKLMRLEQIGIDLRRTASQEQLNQIDAEAGPMIQDYKAGTLLDGNLQRYNELAAKAAPLVTTIEQAQSDSQGLLLKYPKASYYDAEGFAQELLGQRSTGLNLLALKAGEATEHTAQAIPDFINETFRYDDAQKIHQLQTLGSNLADEQLTHITQANTLNQQFTPSVKPSLQKDIDAVKNNPDLSDSDKSKAVTRMLMGRPDEWQRTPIEGGKTNIGITSLFYGVGSMAAELAPYMAAEMLTGGGASAGVMRKFTSSFVSATATAFHDEYTSAVDQGYGNDAFAHAIRATAINSAAMSGAGTPDEIRKILGGTSTAIGTVVSKMTDEDILAALRKEPTALNIFKQQMKNVGSSTLQGAISAAKVVPAITGGQAFNDYLDGNLKPINDYLKQSAIEALKFTVFGAVGGTATKSLEGINDASKAVIYMAGQHPVPFLEALKQKEDNGTISKVDAAQVRQNVENARLVVEKVPFVDNNGDPLGDNGRRELMFLKMQETDLESHMSKDIPPKLLEKMEARLSDVQDKMDKVYKGTFIEDIGKPFEKKAPPPEPEPTETTPITPLIKPSTDEKTKTKETPGEVLTPEVTAPAETNLSPEIIALQKQRDDLVNQRDNPKPLLVDKTNDEGVVIGKKEKPLEGDNLTQYVAGKNQEIAGLDTKIENQNKQESEKRQEDFRATTQQIEENRAADVAKAETPTVKLPERIVGKALRGEVGGQEVVSFGDKTITRKKTIATEQAKIFKEQDTLKKLIECP